MYRVWDNEVEFCSEFFFIGHVKFYEVWSIFSYHYVTVSDFDVADIFFFDEEFIGLSWYSIFFRFCAACYDV